MTKLSQTSQAILLFLYVLLSLAVMKGIVRHISADYHTFQTVFFYNALALLFFIPWVITKGKASFHARNFKMLWVRAILEFISFSLSFYAITQIPMPTHTALLFLTPIFGTIVAITMLGERPSSSTLACVFAGFVGVLLITRPGFQEINIGTVCTMLAALGFALCGATIKVLTRTESSGSIAFYMLLMSAFISAPFGLYYWTTPTLTHFLWFLAIGWIGYSQQIAVAAALSRVPFTTVIPLNFVELVFVSTIAYIFFAELVDMWTVIGAGIIITGTLYNAYHSTRRPAATGDVPA